MGVACLKFHGENVHGWLKNRKIHENFLPRKFPAIHWVILGKGLGYTTKFSYVYTL